MFGLEEILAEELRKMGAQDVKPMNRAVSFKGDKGFMYKTNLNARTALRILKPIAHFQAHDEKELYRKLCEIDWTEIFDLEATFATHATTHSEVFTHSKYASLVMKDAIADTFRKKFDKRPNVDPEMPDMSINLHIAKHTCSVSLDSSGDSLHKRGYKSDAVTAVSDDLRKETYNHFNIDKDIEMIPNFIDTTLYNKKQKDSFRKKFAANNEKIITHISNFRKVKIVVSRHIVFVIDLPMIKNSEIGKSKIQQ